MIHGLDKGFLSPVSSVTRCGPEADRRTSHSLSSSESTYLDSGAYRATMALAVRSPSTAALTIPPA